MKKLLTISLILTNISAKAQVWNNAKLSSELRIMKVTVSSYVSITRSLASENLELKIKVANLQMENLVYKSRIDTLETRVVTYSDDFNVINGEFKIARYNEVLTLIKRVSDLEMIKLKPVQAPTLKGNIQFAY